MNLRKEVLAVDEERVDIGEENIHGGPDRIIGKKTRKKTKGSEEK